jgi:hypothetical protein
MKIVTTTIYNMAIIYRLVEKNSDIISFPSGKSKKIEIIRGFRVEDARKGGAINKIFDDAMDLLNRCIAAYVSRLKNYKNMDLRNTLQLALEEVSSKSFKINKEYLAKDENKYYVIGKLHSEITNHILNEKNLGNVINGIFMFSAEFLAREKLALAMRKNASLNTVDIFIYPNEQFRREIITYSDKKDFTEINKKIRRESMDKYYKNYCPIKFYHTGEPCKNCGYPKEEFYKKYDLPVPKIELSDSSVLQKNIEKAKIIATHNAEKSEKPEKPKYYNIKITSYEYENFWYNFCCFSDVKFAEGLKGKRGNRELGKYQIAGEFSELYIFLSKIANGKFSNFKVPKNINDLLERAARADMIFNTYDVLLNEYIKIFNELPVDIAMFWLKKIFDAQKKIAQPEDEVYASVLSTNISDHEEEIIDSPDKNPYSYDGFDYDGHNEK